MQVHLIACTYLAEIRRLLVSQHSGQSRREREGNALSHDTVFLLSVAEKVAKVDVEQLAITCHHHVVIVAITHTKHIAT